MILLGGNTSGIDPVGGTLLTKQVPPDLTLWKLPSFWVLSPMDGGRDGFCWICPKRKRKGHVSEKGSRYLKSIVKWHHRLQDERTSYRRLGSNVEYMPQSASMVPRWKWLRASMICRWSTTLMWQSRCLYFLKRLRTFGMSPMTLTNIYRCTVESVLSGCITAWFWNSSVQDHEKLKRVVDVAQSISQTLLTPSGPWKSSQRNQSLVPPWLFLILPVPIWQKISSLKACTTRLRNSLFPSLYIS